LISLIKTGIVVVDLIDSRKGSMVYNYPIADQVGLRLERYCEGLIEDLFLNLSSFVNIFFFKW